MERDVIAYFCDREQVCDRADSATAEVYHGKPGTFSVRAFEKEDPRPSLKVLLAVLYCSKFVSFGERRRDQAM